MTATHYIRGTIAVRVDGKNLTIDITPCSGFLSPGKSPNAIAYRSPDKKLEPMESANALVIGLDALKSCELDAQIIKAHATALTTIAGQQKPVELHLKNDASGKLTITGFIYPAP